MFSLFEVKAVQTPPHMTPHTRPQPLGKPPPEPDDPAELPFCDLVLSGGVTSGLLYPDAILRLAHAYRFKNIGGASIGAAVACAAAAAEYTRRRHHSMAGFQGLVDAAKELQQPSGPFQTRLRALFQPQRATRRLFAACLGAIGRASPYRALAGLLAATGLAYAPWWLGGAAVAALALRTTVWTLGFSASSKWFVVSALAAAALGAVVALVWRLHRDLSRELVDNDYGLCRGHGPRAMVAGTKQLTEWMHESIQALAGRSASRCAPLTFANLWHPREEDPSKGRGPREINCQIVISNLSHGRPYTLPQAEPGEVGYDPRDRLYFCPDEWRALFPDAVMDHLLEKSEPYQQEDEAVDPAPPGVNPGLRRLPGANLPLVIAARMSLSVPLLLSAVPVWAIDCEGPRGQRRMRRCLISDGGVCSNFPVHLFDAPIPRWPTFAISIGRADPETLVRTQATEPRHLHVPDRVWLPPNDASGRADVWHRFDQRRSGLARLTGFVGALISTATDWQDHLESRAPGTRDRVVRVALEPGEGGLNLNMSPAEIRDLMAYGEVAGQRLLDRFWQADSSGWREQRWIRFNTWLVALHESLASLPAAIDVDGRPPTATGGLPLDLRAQISDALTDPPLDGSGSDCLRHEQALALADALDALLRLKATLDAAPPDAYDPVPRPKLRTRPPH